MHPARTLVETSAIGDPFEAADLGDIDEAVDRAVIAEQLDENGDDAELVEVLDIIAAEELPEPVDGEDRPVADDEDSSGYAVSEGWPAELAPVEQPETSEREDTGSPFDEAPVDDAPLRAPRPRRRRAASRPAGPPQPVEQPGS